MESIIEIGKHKNDCSESRIVVVQLYLKLAVLCTNTVCVLSQCSNFPVPSEIAS